MKKQNKWRMNRAGLFNFWYYDDEIFDFADGKLLLRGSNGSGKSVTMQSILPVLLDGRKSPDRLDPFGSRARKMEDYLLGEKGVVDRDERTGYLFIEYKREDTDQYLTTGIGLQARRNKAMNFWGFVITDNRRMNQDFYLYEMEYHAGEKQQIPLSRVQLENRIASGGHVVRTQGEYMKLVNKYIFGFETLEAYEDLIKLLIQLRSPKLSKDFRPTVIYEILEAALPPLTDDDLRHLSDTIEHMDQTKQQIEQLDRESTALDRLLQRYDTYNEYQLVQKANGFIKTNKRLQEEKEEMAMKARKEKALSEEIESLEERSRKLLQTLNVLSEKENRLQNHKVWNLEKEKREKVDQLHALDNDFTKKDRQLTEKKRQELGTKESMDTIEGKLVENKEEITDLLEEMQVDAEDAAFEAHDLNEKDFLRNKQETFDFSVWKREASIHYERLDHIMENLREFEYLKKKIVDFQKQIADIHLQVDKERHEEKDWLRIFEEDKQKKLNDLYRWSEENAFFSVGETILQSVARLMDQLYEGNTYEEVRAPFVKLNQVFQLQINKEIALNEVKQEKLEMDLKDREQELDKWQNMPDPIPPFQQKETGEARRLLKEKGIPFLPFYEAVEFQDSVPVSVRKRMESALLDAGLLDALIIDSNVSIMHDKIVTPKPNMMAHTLADYLQPDIADYAHTTISKTLIDEVLRTIVVDDEIDNSDVCIKEDGTYKVGLLKGHAVPVEAVRFIGRNARRRYQKEQITLLEEEIAAIQQQVKNRETEKKDLQKKISDANDAMKRFPNDNDLQEGFSQIQKKRLKLDSLYQELERLDKSMQETNRAYQTVKHTLDEQTRHVNIAFSFEAYTKAKQIMHGYEKILHSLITLHTNFLHLQSRLKNLHERLEELIDEVDDLHGELNVLSDKITRTKRHIEEIKKQLELQGVQDIRQQIEEVQQNLDSAKQELDSNKSTIPYKKSNQHNLKKELEDHQQNEQFLTKIVQAWIRAFSQEVEYAFVDMPNDINTNEQLALWVLKTYRQLLEEKDGAKINEQLTKMFYEQQSNLMEYRMIDEQVVVDDYPWMRGEFSEIQQLQLADWKQKTKRRLIRLDFQGKRVSPYYVKKMVEKDQLRQQYLLDDQDRKLYEEILFDSVGKKLRSRIARAQRWTSKMDDLMKKSDSSSGLSFSIKWKPRTAETEAEMDTKELVELLRRDPRLLKDEDVEQVIHHFRSKIDRAKELVEVKGEGSTLLQVLKDVLDYRYWFSFVLSYQREGETKRELTNHAFYQFSGGEKAMAMYIPLFTACYSRYLEAAPTAPYIISLDEAFAGVDEDNISVMFQIVEELGFDYMMNSQVLWGDYDTVSSLSICELVRPKNKDFVTVIRYIWDGKKRSLLQEDEKKKELEVSDKI